MCRSTQFAAVTVIEFRGHYTKFPPPSASSRSRTFGPGFCRARLRPVIASNCCTNAASPSGRPVPSERRNVNYVLCPWNSKEIYPPLEKTHETQKIYLVDCTQ